MVEQRGHILRQPRTAIGNHDSQLPGAVRCRNGDETAIRRGRARIQQQIERDLADRRAVDREWLDDAVIPLEMEVPRLALMLHEEAQIVEIDPGQNARLGAPLIGYEGRANDVANAGEPTLQEVQRRLQHGRLVAIRLDRVNGIEHSSERVVDLVGHARGKPPEHRALFLLGKMGREDLAFAKDARHRIEAIKQLTKLAGDPTAVTRWNRLHPPFSNVLHIACEDTQWLQHPLQHEVSAERESERQAPVHQDEREQDLAANPATRRRRPPRRTGVPRETPRYAASSPAKRDRHRSRFRDRRLLRTAGAARRAPHSGPGNGADRTKPESSRSAARGLRSVVRCRHIGRFARGRGRQTPPAHLCGQRPVERRRRDRRDRRRSAARDCSSDPGRTARARPATS